MVATNERLHVNKLTKWYRCPNSMMQVYLSLPRKLTKWYTCPNSMMQCVFVSSVFWRCLNLPCIVYLFLPSSEDLWIFRLLIPMTWTSCRQLVLAATNATWHGISLQVQYEQICSRWIGIVYKTAAYLVYLHVPWLWLRLSSKWWKGKNKIKVWLSN